MTGSLRYEWVRISTVRSTWVLVALAIVLPAGFAVFLTWLISAALGPASGDPQGGPTGGITVFVPLVAALLCTIGAAAFGQEYRHGLIRITLSTFPRRTPVFLAKAVMVAAFTVVAAAAAIVAVVLGEALGGVIGGGGLQWDDAAVSGMGLRCLIYIVLFVLIAFALTALTRNQPLGIIVPILLATVVEGIISVIAQVNDWAWMTWVLPFTGAMAGVTGEGPEAWGHLGVLALWFLVLAVPAWLLFEKRDA